MKIIRRLMTAGLIIIALGYFFALLKIVLFKYGFSTGLRSLNIKPFAFLNMFSNGFALDVALKNILGNIAIFMPLGIFATFLFKKKKWMAVLVGFGVSILFEVIQFVSGCGATDIDDIILNTLGAFLGTALYLMILNRLDQKIKLPVATLIFLTFFGGCGVLSLYLLEPNMLPADIETVNEEIVSNLDLDDCDINTMAYDITDNKIETTTDANRIRTSKNRDIKLSADGKYILADDARLIEQKQEYKFSPNGNIQKTTITYSEITEKEMKVILQKRNGEGTFVSINLNEAGEIRDIIITVW